MNYMKFRNVLATGFLLLAVAACKKDKKEDTVTKNSLSGTPSFEMPGFVGKGDSFTLTPSGVTNPSGSTGYYWTGSWFSAKDTTKRENETGNGAYAVTAPRFTGTYTLSCVAFATGYYTSSGMRTFHVVDPTRDSTLQGLDMHPGLDPTLVDPRDSRTYYTKTIGGKLWTRTNLAYAESGVPYENCAVMDLIFGRFYNWNEAQSACPAGWHLPSDAEWAELCGTVNGTTCTPGENFTGAAGSLMVNASFLNKRMWEYWPEVRITNKSEMSVIPVGFGVDAQGHCRFKGLNDYAAFWTSDSKGENGVYRYLQVKNPDVFVSLGDKESFRACVRCVKD